MYISMIFVQYFVEQQKRAFANSERSYYKSVKNFFRLQIFHKKERPIHRQAFIGISYRRKSRLSQEVSA